MDINEICETTQDGYISKPIMITITLAEYRFLIQENQRLLCENNALAEQLCKFKERAVGVND